LGRRFDGGEDEGLPLAQADSGGQLEFREWTPGDHLRHSRFVALRDTKATDLKRGIQNEGGLT
jgi:hypothetical protein